METIVKGNIKKILNDKHEGNILSEEELISTIKDIFKTYKSRYPDETEEELIYRGLSYYIHKSKKEDTYYIKTSAINKNREEMYNFIININEEGENEDDDKDDDESENDSDEDIDKTDERRYNLTTMLKRKLGFIRGKYDYPCESEIKYKYKKRTREEHGEAYGPFGTQWIHDVQVDDKWGEKEMRRAKIFDMLRKIVLPEQRTKEWFEMRENKITASDCGTVINENKHEPQFMFILKKIEPPPFLSNKYCYHGKKYEEIATMVYEYRMNVKVEEFGLMGDKSISIIGASPDGICSMYKLDGKTKSKYVGRMLEIKCPLSRKINLSGPIKDNICPKYYWAQVQQQLQCCDLDECDFWQVDIQEYKSREEFMNDTDPDEPFRSIETGFEKGAIIQLLPSESYKLFFNDGKKDFNKYWDEVYNNAIFLYPPKIEMTPMECDKWISEQLSEFKNNKKYWNYEFDRIYYWKICLTKNVLIKRNKKWFNEKLPLMEKIWKYVEYYRSNTDIKNIIVKYINTLIKSDDEYTRKKEGMKYNDHVMEIFEIMSNNKHEKYKETYKLIIDKINKHDIEMKNSKTYYMNDISSTNDTDYTGDFEIVS
jgi:putative phage-type endonuclease